MICLDKLRSNSIKYLAQSRFIFSSCFIRMDIYEEKKNEHLQTIANKREATSVLIKTLNRKHTRLRLCNFSPYRNLKLAPLFPCVVHCQRVAPISNYGIFFVRRRKLKKSLH